MNILGIETSCDETSAAVVQDGTFILSNVVATSLGDHQRFGGVIPEIASRRQLEYIPLVVKEALGRARVSLDDIGAIAVTTHPGLIGSLLVGVTYASALAYAQGIPLVEVDHIRAHIYANYLLDPNGPDDRKMPLEQYPFPVVGLVVSGGHSSLFLIRDPRTYRLIGETRDDAAGEAYDKVARILGLGYPGGPVIDRLACGYVPGSNPALAAVKFKCAPLAGSDDFSFSGVKTAVLYHARQRNMSDPAELAAAAAAFQNSVVGVLTEKSLEVCHKYGVRSLLVGGGVAANSGLRRSLQERGAREGIAVSFPSMPLCMDNGAMIAGLGYHLLTRPEHSVIKK